MEGAPESWPPVEGETVRRVLPVFPLPSVWLLPYLILPLRIFEPRYKQMVEDCLDGPGWIVLGTVVEGHEQELAGAPPIHPVAGLGEIGRHQRLPNGDYDVVLVGIQRVRVKEVPSDRLYRKVEVEPASEIPIPIQHDSLLRGQLVEALSARVKEPIAIPEEVPISHLVDLLTLHVPLPPAQMSRIFVEADLERRTRLVLAEHGRRPHAPPGASPPQLRFFRGFLRDPEQGGDEAEGDDTGADPT